MSSPSNTFQLRNAYFHKYSKTSMHDLQNLFESTIRSGHRILPDDIWIDYIPFCGNDISADNFYNGNPNIIKKHTKVILEEIPGTNNQCFRYKESGIVKNKWVNPADYSDGGGNTSQGFAVKLYDNNDNLISLSDGVWAVDYFSGLIQFQEGYTPIEKNYSLPLKISFYEYIGNTFNDFINNSNQREIVTERIDFADYFNLSSNKISDSYFGTVINMVVTDDNGDVVYQ